MYLSLPLYLHRPNDSRMLVAMGDCYSILGRVVEAKKVGGVSFIVCILVISCVCLFL